jgi:hypothetical protein
MVAGARQEADLLVAIDPDAEASIAARANQLLVHRQTLDHGIRSRDRSAKIMPDGHERRMVGSTDQEAMTNVRAGVQFKW